MLTIFPVIILLLMIVLFFSCCFLRQHCTATYRFSLIMGHGDLGFLTQLEPSAIFFLSNFILPKTPQSTNKCSIQITHHSLLFLYTTLWEASRRGLTDTGRQIALYPPLFVKVVSIPHCHERWSVCLPGATLLLGDKFHFLLPFS